MPARVRLALDARPGLLKRRQLQARVDVGLARARAHLIVDGPVDAVLRVLVPGAQRVGVVGKGPRGDAPVTPGAVAAEAVGGVKEDRVAELARVLLFVPVPVTGSVPNQSVLDGVNGRDSRLIARVAALVAEGALVGVHHHAVEGEECALGSVSGMSVDCDQG
jgi:hypothetical protein